MIFELEQIIKNLHECFTKLQLSMRILYKLHTNIILMRITHNTKSIQFLYDCLYEHFMNVPRSIYEAFQNFGLIRLILGIP